MFTLHKYWKIFLPVLTSLFLFNSSSDINSCGGGGYYEETDNLSFFDYSIVNHPQLVEYYPTQLMVDWKYQDSIYKTSLINPVNSNIIDWQSYFNIDVKKKDIKEIIYTSNKNELIDIKNLITSGKGFLRDYKTINSAVNYLIENKDTSTIKYIVFAKECEPEVTKDISWRYEERDTVLMKNLIMRGISYHDQCDSEFIKLRYGYQIVRLAHYIGEYEKAVKYYNRFVEQNKTKSIIKYWALSHKAGCLLKTNKNGEALYQFAKIFNECPSRQSIAKRSFIINENSDLNEALIYCKTSEDSNGVWWLTGLKYNQHTLKSLTEIYKTAPLSPYLEILLTQEIRNSEYRLLPDQYNFHPFTTIVTSRDSIFSGFLEKVCSESETNYPFLWNYALGYHLTLTNLPYKALKHYKIANSHWPTDDKLNKDRLKILEIISSIDTAKIINKSFENDFFDKLQWIESIHYSNEPELSHLEDKYFANDAFGYVLQKLANRYLEQSDTIRYHLCLGSGRFENYSLTLKPNIELINNLLEFYEKPNKSEFEQKMLEWNHYKKTDFLRIKGILFLSEYKLKQAVETFSKIDWNYFGPLHTDPFSIRINDCRDCDFNESRNKVIPYNLLTFTEELIELEKLKNTDTINTAQHYFNLANAYYNITHFGNSSEIIDFNRDSDFSFFGNNNFPDSLQGKLWKPGGEHVDCSRSEEYYKKAQELSNDQEFKAMCCFMASKCEQNRYYITYIKHTKENKKKFRTHFRKLYGEYSDTEFYREVISECKYFNYFVENYVNKR